MTTEATTIDANPASSDADTTTAEEAPTTTPLTADTAQTLRHDVDANKNFGLITSLEQLQAFADRLIKANTPIGFDIETGYYGPPQESGSLFPQYGGFVVGFSFTNDEKWARYVPLRHDDSEKNLDNKRVAEIWWPVYSSGCGSIVAGSGRLTASATSDSACRRLSATWSTHQRSNSA